MKYQYTSVQKIQAVNWKTMLVLAHVWVLAWVGVAPAQDPPAETVPDQKDLSFFGVVKESMFGDPTDDPWYPLSLSTFFTDGWDEPFDYPTDGSGGAPRQGWINAFDGVFYRLWFFNYSYTHNFNNNGHQHLAGYTVFTPVNRRFQFRFDVPFFVRNRGGSGNDYNTNFGDFVVRPRFLLSESQDFTQILDISVRTPTGNEENGNDIFSVTPQYEFWYNVSGLWVVRGGFGSTLPTSDNRGRYSFNWNFAAGRYLTPHDMTPFGDLTLYVASDGFTTLDDRGDDRTFYSLTPGFRNHLGQDWYLLGGVEFPVTGPPSSSFDYEPNVWLMKVW